MNLYFYLSKIPTTICQELLVLCQYLIVQAVTFEYLLKIVFNCNLSHIACFQSKTLN